MIGPIYGPLTERENELVERTYMGALFAKQILDSCDFPADFNPANRATHVAGTEASEGECKQSLWDHERHCWRDGLNG